MLNDFLARADDTPLSSGRGRRKLAATGISGPHKDVLPVPAEAHSDDQQISARFDAAPWFEQASDEEIVALALENFEPSYEADDVALFFEETNVQVAKLFSYLHEDPHPRLANGDPCGFECEVELEAAMAWLEQERPHLDAWISGEVNFATPHYQVVVVGNGSSGEDCADVRETATDTLIATFAEQSEAEAHALKLEAERG